MTKNRDKNPTHRGEESQRVREGEQKATPGQHLIGTRPLAIYVLAMATDRMSDGGGGRVVLIAIMRG
jgi:hypothetical protein